MINHVLQYPMDAHASHVFKHLNEYRVLNAIDQGEIYVSDPEAFFKWMGISASVAVVTAYPEIGESPGVNWFGLWMPVMVDSSVPLGKVRFRLFYA